jgi:hypothetical protein
MKQNQDDTVKEITSYFLKWIGIVVCILCAVSFFINSEWVAKQIIETQMTYSNDDSEAANLLYKMEVFMIDAAIWLKKLPTSLKVTGLVLGGLLWFSNSED